jgi:hypothetical protein
MLSTCGDRIFSRGGSKGLALEPNVEVKLEEGNRWDSGKRAEVIGNIFW